MRTGKISDVAFCWAGLSTGALRRARGFCGWLVSSVLLFTSATAASAILMGMFGVCFGADGRVGGASGILAILGFIWGLALGATFGSTGAVLCADAVLCAGAFIASSASGVFAALLAVLALPDLGMVGVKLIPPPSANVSGLLDFTLFFSAVSSGFSAVFCSPDITSRGFIAFG